MRHLGSGTRWKSLARGLAGAILSTLLPAVCSATTIGLSPANNTINQGDILTLSVNVTDAPDLYLFQFGVSYDPSIFTPIAPQDGLLLNPVDSLLDPLDPLGFFDAGCPFTCAAPAGTMALIQGF